MQTLTPTAVRLNNLSGSAADLDDSPDDPDGSWCTRLGLYAWFVYPSSGALTLAGQTVTAVANAEAPLFFDDFSTADFSNHNDYFRWGGDGGIPGEESELMPLDSVAGPYGPNVNAMRFQYGTWQEVRFHLTSSASESRTETGSSSTVWPVVWMSYWLYVPANYAHGPGNPSNNKGFVVLWKDSYLSNDTTAVWDWDRTGTANSRLRCSMLDKTYKGYEWPVHVDEFTTVESSHLLPSTSDQAYAFRPSTDVGRWQHIAVGYKMADSASVHNGYIKLYRDGVLAAERVNQDSYVAAPINGMDRGYLFGYHNAGYTETTTFYITHLRLGLSLESVLP